MVQFDPVPEIFKSHFILKRPEPRLKGGIVISCQLLPWRTTALILVVCVVAAVFFFVVTGGAAGWISFLFQLLFIFVVIAHSIALKVAFSDRGVRAQSFVHRELMYNRLTRDWDDIHSVRLYKLYSPELVVRRLTVNRDKKKYSFWQRLVHSTLAPWGRQGFLVFDFKSGGSMPLPIAGIPDEQLEELFVSLARWADPLALNADVLSLQRDVLMGETVCLSVSYTRMWEEELRKRFEVTNFVPLSGGHKLQDGGIQVLMQLASGGMSSVYLARLADGERVVLKELVVPADRDGRVQEQVKEMFDREARVLSRLDHEQIVRVLDHFVEDGRNYLVMQQARGLTFRQQVQLEGPVREGLVVEVARQLVEIATYLHGQNPPVIHRDITPDNLVFDLDSTRVTLIDFGAANEFVGHVTGTLVGKQCYLPPEQFRGKAEPASDIYAIGATLYFLLTGEDPMPISVSSPKKLLAEVNSELNSLVERATALDAEERISAEELKRSLAILSLPKHQDG